MARSSALIHTPSPDLMPVLSRGKHRNAKKGACFMEYASFVAGERFTDHPECTDPSLASLARLVNDWTTDANRSSLSTLVPSVVGLVSAGPVRSDDDRAPDNVAPTAAGAAATRRRLQLSLAILAASAAIPVASEPRQRALAIALEQCLRDLESGFPRDAATMSRIATNALAQAPLAARRARDFIAGIPTLTAREESRRERTLVPRCDAIMAMAVAGIGEACVADGDARLRALLETAIESTAAIIRPVRREVPVERQFARAR